MVGDTTYPIEYKLIPWSIVAAVFMICGIIFLTRNRNIIKEFKLHRQFNIFACLVFFSVAVIRVLFIFSDFERRAHGKSMLHFQFLYYSYFLGYLSYSLLIYYFDKNFIKSRHLFLTKIAIAYTIFSAVILFIYPIIYGILDLFRYIVYSGLILSNLIIGVILIKIIREIDVKRIQRYVWGTFGFLLIVFGIFLDIDFLYDLIYRNYPYLALIPPIFVISGLIIFTLNIDLSFDILLEYYTTKQICLVHRGEIKGKIFFCPKCLVKYCNNCFNSVITIENKCWACSYIFSADAPILEPSLSKEIDNIETIDNSRKKKG